MKSPQIVWINNDDPPEAFPEIESASKNPDGLLAVGGDLSEERLLYAYRRGIFPWFSDGQPVLWWAPDPRCVLRPDQFRVSRRLHRSFRSSTFEIHINRAFDDVIAACAEDRAGQDGTWITLDMRHAYRALYEQGWAHSIEVWQSGSLVGGLYGLAINKVFFGESMFSRKSDASKGAMLALCNIIDRHGFALLDCQVESSHLLTLGATLMPRSEFSEVLQESCAGTEKFDAWPEKPSNIAKFPRLTGHQRIALDPAFLHNSAR